MKTKKNTLSYDFGGYATKVGHKCSDGRVILHNAFVNDDGARVPLVWQHLHNEPSNILGHAILENREDGVYAYCSFNTSKESNSAKTAIGHGDIQALSIYANNLVEKDGRVSHGAIREVSLVIAGANPAAFIDNISFAHGDGTVTEDNTEAVISFMQPLASDAGGQEEPSVTETIAHAGATKDEPTLADIFGTFNEEQKLVVYALIGQAVADAEEAKAEVKQSALNQPSESTEGEAMKHNIFTGQQEAIANPNLTKNAALAHEELTAIFDDARRTGSLKDAFLRHEGTYGIDNIDVLFPDAQTVTGEPKFVARDMSWVRDVFGAAHPSPFSRIKTVVADLTADEARARGYTKTNEKVDEVIALLKRTTSPTTVYKKQKLDRDDVIDITDMNIVAWLKSEMRMMLEEEIARAILVGDGRLASSDDKIAEDSIRPIAKDDSLYSISVEVEEDTTTSELIDAIVLARKDYKGRGNPTFFSTPDVVGDMLLLKDSTGRRIYNTLNDLAAALRVEKIVEVPVMENTVRVITPDVSAAVLLGIVVNMQDYTVGADKGGAVNMFDDFDIDYNQYKYLIETRCSGALTAPLSALVIERTTDISG